MAFVEFQKHYRLALKVHKDCLLAVSGPGLRLCDWLHNGCVRVVHEGCLLVGSGLLYRCVL